MWNFHIVQSNGNVGAIKRDKNLEKTCSDRKKNSRSPHGDEQDAERNIYWSSNNWEERGSVAEE